MVTARIVPGMSSSFRTARRCVIRQHRAILTKALITWEHQSSGTTPRV